LSQRIRMAQEQHQKFSEYVRYFHLFFFSQLLIQLICSACSGCINLV
jgi:hypothetical protein